MTSPRHKDLGAALDAHISVLKRYTDVMTKLADAKLRNDYNAAMKLWKEGHELVIELKGAHNAVYGAIGELKPTKADKLKPGNKLDNASAGTKRDQKADARRAEEAAETKSTPKAGKKGDRTAALERKADRKNKRRAETEDTAPIMAGTASDEPTDVGDDPDAP